MNNHTKHCSEVNFKEEQYLLAVGSGQRYLFLHQFFTKLDQLRQPTLDSKAQHLQHQFDIREIGPKATGLDFEGALVVDEVDHVLESLGVGFVEEKPLVLRIAQLGAEIWAGNGQEEPVTSKLLPEINTYISFMKQKSQYFS